MKNLSNNSPIWVYLSAIFVIVAFCFIGIPILSIGSYGGEQKPFVLLSHAIDWSVYGFLILSFLTSFIFWNWFKKYWYINVSIFSICFIMLYYFYWNDKYYNEYETEYIGNNVIGINKQYYLSNRKIRSIMYWKNNKMDSIWTVFDKEGKIIEKKFYRNDSLIKVIK
jgi:hypothetical protein